MGQKIHPVGLRIGIIRDWESKWFYDKKQYAAIVAEDANIRSTIKRRWASASLSRVEIERAADRVKVTLFSARPGAIIGRGGKGIEEVTALVEKIAFKRATGSKVEVNVNEIRFPDVDAQLVAENIASQLERRISHRRAMRQSIMRAMRNNAMGIRVRCAGRLGGSEMARIENDRQGKIPLQTLRSDIDFGVATAFTIYGSIGVKVWVYRGDILPERARESTLGEMRQREIAQPDRGGRRDRAPRAGDRDRDRGGYGARPSQGGRGGHGGGYGSQRSGGYRGGRLQGGTTPPPSSQDETTTPLPTQPEGGTEGNGNS